MIINCGNILITSGSNLVDIFIYQINIKTLYKCILEQGQISIIDEINMASQEFMEIASMTYIPSTNCVLFIPINGDVLLKKTESLEQISLENFDGLEYK